ncbi:hypothetical protein SCUP234_09225 [Seiridium cupressi]
MFLPQEIWVAILGHLGLHSDTFEVLIERHIATRNTLALLCRVSKDLNAAAMPMLYSHVRLFDGDAPFFTRTILGSLDLRRLVRKLSLEFELPGRWEPEEVGPERRQKVPSVDKEQWHYDGCLGEVLALLGPDAKPAGVGGADILVAGMAYGPNLDGVGDQLEEDVAAALLFVLPELRHLRIKLDPMIDWEYEDSAGYWRCKLLMQTLRLPFYARSQQPDRTDSDIRPLIPASLLHLQELVLCNPFEEPGTIKASYPPIVFGQIVEMQPFWGLPNLRTLTLERAAWQQHPFRMLQPMNSSVEHLQLLNTAIPPSTMPLILEQFPSLRSITYELADSWSLVSYDADRSIRDMLDKQEIENIIRSCHPNIECIRIAGIERVEEYEEVINEVLGLGETDDEEDASV